VGKRKAKQQGNVFVGISLYASLMCMYTITFERLDVESSFFGLRG